LVQAGCSPLHLLNGKRAGQISTFGRGDFLCEMTFLDGNARSADAIAFNDVDLFVPSRKAFEALADVPQKVALKLMECLASVLAARLRYTTAELLAPAW
jgi:sulfate permease, SulP family